MKIQNIKNITKNSCVLSLIINVIVLAFVLACTPLMYETNDDYAIAEMISNNYPYVGFVNYYLCKILIAIQSEFANINAFMFSQIILSFIAFTMLLHVIIKKSRDRLHIIMASLAIILFSFDHYSFLQFTKTSALLMTASLVTIVDNYTGKRSVPIFVISFLMFFTGVAYRQKGMFPALAFAGIFMMIWFFMNGNEYFRERQVVKEVVVILVLIVLSITPYGIDKMSDAANESTQELKIAREYQAERVKITDYPLIDYYDINAEKYKAAGFDRNDLNLIRKFYLDYNGAASLENLKSINNINYQYMISKNSIRKAVYTSLKSVSKGICTLSFIGMHILTALLFAIYIVIGTKKRNIAYIVGIGCIAVSIYVALYYQGRPLYRATYVADIGTVFWLLYIAVQSKSDHSKHNNISSIMLCFCIIIGLLYFTHNAIDDLNGQRKYTEKQVESQIMTDYYKDNNEYTFVVPTGAQKNQKAYLNPLKVPNSLPNITGTGGWQTLSPFKMDSLRRLGMTNPIKDLINNPNAYLVGDYKKKELNEYLNKWYCTGDEVISFIKVDEIEENNIYSIVKLH